MADDHQLVTIWLRNRKSADQKVRDEAWHGIHEWLKGRITTTGMLDAKVAVRTGASDVCQEALLAAVKNDNDFEDREAFFRWFCKKLSREASNLRRYHHQKKRDVRCEVPPSDAADGDNESGAGLLDQGRRPIAECPRPERNPRNSRPISTEPDSFDGDHAHQIVYGDQPVLDSVLCIEAIESLEEFDDKNSTCLATVAVYSLERRTADEIACLLTQQGHKISKRTVERYRVRIAEQLELAKEVILSVEPDTGEWQESRRLILPNVTATQLLKRLRLPGYRLVRIECGARPEHAFAAAENLYSFVEARDTLEARLSIA